MTWLVLATLAQSLSAQTPRYPTIGIDAGAGIGTGTASTLTVDLPLQQVRIGFAFSNRLSIEPFGSFSYVKQSGGDGFTSFALGTGLVYRLRSDTAETRPYLRPFASLEAITGAGSTDARLRAGAGVGAERRMTRVLAVRAEVGISHGGAIEITPAFTTLDMLVGLTIAVR